MRPAHCRRPAQLPRAIRGNRGPLWRALLFILRDCRPGSLYVYVALRDAFPHSFRIEPLIPPMDPGLPARVPGFEFLPVEIPWVFGAEAETVYR